MGLCNWGGRSGGSGSATVTTGGLLQVNSALSGIVGALGASGTLAVNNGGTGTVTVGALGAVEVTAPTNAASGTVTVTGAGALLTSDSGIGVGLLSDGSVTVSQGGSTAAATQSYGDGCAGFDVALPLPLAPDRARAIHVRRAVDGRELPGSPIHLPAVASAIEQARAGLRAFRSGAARAPPAEIDTPPAELAEWMEALRAEGDRGPP